MRLRDEYVRLGIIFINNHMEISRYYKSSLIYKVKLATVVEGDPKAPFFDSYYTKV